MVERRHKHTGGASFEGRSLYQDQAWTASRNPRGSMVEQVLLRNGEDPLNYMSPKALKRLRRTAQSDLPTGTKVSAKG